MIGPLPLTCRSVFEGHWHGFGGKRKGVVLWNTTVAALFWVVWQERNRRIFSDKYRSLVDLWDSVVFLALLLVSVTKEFADDSFFFIRDN